MERNEEKYIRNSDEASLKEILLKIREYGNFFWSKKLYFIVSFSIFVAIFIYRANTTPALFIGETKFFVEGNEGSSMSGLGGLLGQIGVGGNKSNPYQIIEVALSKLHMVDVLFEKMGQDSVFIANRVLNTYNLPEEWAEDDPEYRDFRFTHDSIEAFTRLEDKALIKGIMRVIDNSKNKALMTADIEEDKGYYFIKAKSIDHDLTLRLLEVSYEKLRIYFEEKTKEKLKTTRDLLKVKSDSIKSLLDLKISQLADFKDRNRSIVNYRGQVQEAVFESEISGLNSAYMEILRSFEMADYKFRDQQNNFMLIDKPLAPLGLVFKNWAIEGVRGGILAIILTFILLFVMKFYRDIMNS